MVNVAHLMATEKALARSFTISGLSEEAIRISRLNAAGLRIEIDKLRDKIALLRSGLPDRSPHGKFSILVGARQQKGNSSKASAPSQTLFRTAELFARILPAKTRLESFEPSYNDEKSDYLKARKCYGGGLARAWLAFWFAVHVVIMVCQCLWGMCSETVKGFLLRLPSEIFRRL